MYIYNIYIYIYASYYIYVLHICIYIYIYIERERHREREKERLVVHVICNILTCVSLLREVPRSAAKHCEKKLPPKEKQPNDIDMWRLLKTIRNEYMKFKPCSKACEDERQAIGM